MGTANPDQTKVTVALPTEELEAFRSKFPSHGSITWFLSEALTRFNKIFEVDPHTAIDEAVESIDLTGE